MLDKKDIEKIEKIIQERKTSHSLLMKNSEVYKAFLKVEQAAFKDGKLSKKYKELIALGISLAINCEPCMEHHINQALTSGASYDEIIETIGVSIEMGGGPKCASSRFALKVLEYYTKS